MAAAATTGLQRPLPAQAGGAAQPLAQQQQQQQQDFDSAQRLSQAFAQYQQEQQVAALLQQANNGMGGGSFAGSLSLAHALAASGLLGGLPGLGPHQPAPLASLPGLAGMGQLQGLGGGLGAQAGLGGLDPLGLHALQQMQQASQGLGLGLGQLQALQSLGALGSLPGGLGSLPGGASFGAQPQLGLGSLQAPVPPQQQQQQVAVALGPGYGMQQGGVVRGAEQLDRELLQQLQQLNDAHLARSHPPHGPAPPTAATRDASAAPLPLQQPAPPPIQQDTAAEVAVRQRQLEFEALLYQQQQQQQQQQAGAAPLQQPAPPPAAEGSRPQRRRLPSGKAAATEAPQFAAAKAPSAMLPRTATATLALSAGGPPPLLQQPSVASISLQQPSTGRGVRSGSAGADFDSGEEGAEGMGGDGRLAEARRKNREAQQRFRERQRAAAREAEAKYQEMLDQVCQLRLENAELAQRNYYMSAALAVRDSMLQAFKLGQRGSTPSHSVGAPPEQPQPPSQPAGAQPPGQPQGEEARDGSSAMASGAEAAKASADAAAAAASNVAPSGGGSPALAAAGEAGGAASGSGVRSSRGQSSTEIEEVQPASRGALGDPVSLTTARLMRSPDDLCTYYRQAQVEMRFALQVYLENGRAEEDRAAVEAAHQLMQDVWAHTMALFPDGVKNFIHDLSCPDGLDAERWEALAAKLVFSDDSLQILFTGYRRYLKQNARIARERQHLQQQLARLLEVAQEAALIPAEDWALGMHMQAQAAALVEALDVAQGLNHLGDLEFHSRMDFCIPWCTSVGQFQMALVNAESTPYIPQFLELARRVLRLAAESGRLVGSNGSLLTLGEVEDVAGDGGVSRHMRVEIEEQEEEVEEKLQHEGHEEQQAHQKTAIKEEPATNGAELHAASVDGADKAASAVDGQSTVPVAAPAAS